MQTLNFTLLTSLVVKLSDSLRRFCLLKLSDFAMIVSLLLKVARRHCFVKGTWEQDIDKELIKNQN